MTDNEIVKAYINCIGVHQSTDCQECPYHHEEDGCYEKMTDDILSLINRQKTEIEALIAGQETLQKHIAKQKEENKWLQDQLSKSEAEIAKQESKIERLQHLLNSKAFVLADDKKKQAKAEAIKEFAERLKKVLGFGRYISYEQIDNLVKEMVGDEDE